MVELFSMRRLRFALPLLFAFSSAGLAQASVPEEAKGLWLTAEKDAVIEFANCPDRAGSLCGRIVWDKDAGTPADTCGMQIAQLNRFEDEAWRDGWVYDPRDKKSYKAAIRVKGGTLNIRAYIGVEVLGETEQLTRTDALPASPVCKK
jgi:uncharacterized protein (DUF2147 family)